jgi:diaminohydroxyphosphoribosylaminopyrimidine deaminase / 5-amino-6-(5-phosphoribosylamino)uracil reductase
MEQEHVNYMTRCLQLARLGEGHTAPNPMVGCVIVHDGKIIGEGFHQKCGGPHAEVNAIRSVKDPGLLRQSTLYVNLEPCSHFGKTPPCAKLIIEKAIPEVIVGTLDPNPLVSGKGIESLREAGCAVSIGVAESECRELNRRFFTFQEKQRPYVILKWAQTQDGFIDSERVPGEEAKPVWITDEIARIAVHKQRSTEGAILIGTNTALKDNPSLTLRDWYGNQPLRILFDRNHRLPSSLKLFDGKATTFTVTKEPYPDGRPTDYLCTSDEDILRSLLLKLFNLGIQSLIVEGGAVTLQQFIDSSLWDEAHVYIGEKSFGKGIKAPKLKLVSASKEIFSHAYGLSTLNVVRNHSL